jgi:hypothetical protein
LGIEHLDNQALGLHVVKAAHRALQSDHAHFLRAISVDNRRAQQLVTTGAQVEAQRFADGAHLFERLRSLPAPRQAVDQGPQVGRIGQEIGGVFLQEPTRQLVDVS